MFRYKVDYWDKAEMDRHNADGLIDSTEWGEAAERLRTFYGKDNVIGIYIEEWTGIVETEDVIRSLTEENK